MWDILVFGLRHGRVITSLRKNGYNYLSIPPPRCRFSKSLDYKVPLGFIHWPAISPSCSDWKYSTPWANTICCNCIFLFGFVCAWYIFKSMDTSIFISLWTYRKLFQGYWVLPIFSLSNLGTVRFTITHFNSFQKSHYKNWTLSQSRRETGVLMCLSLPWNIGRPVSYMWTIENDLHHIVGNTWYEV